MRRKKTAIAIAISACLALTATACSPGADSGAPPSTGPDEITVAIGAAVQSFDPLASVSGADYSYFYLVYDTLIDLDESSAAAPGLAESWDVPDDTTIVLHLRDGVTFHDGTAFDAEAVKWNLERANSETSNTRDLASIESIDTPDPLTVQLNLSRPDASIILVLSDRPGTMISPSAYEAAGEDYTLNPVGTGPFKVSESIPGQSVTYVANESYWKEGLPGVDKIEFKVMGDPNTVLNALRSGQVDVSGLDPSNISLFENDPKFNVEVSQQLVYRQLLLNTAMPPLNDINIRKAIEVAIDKDAINEALTQGYGTAATQSFPEGYMAYNPSIKPDYDPDLARKLVAESGLSKDELKLRITFFAGIGSWPDLAEATAAQLRDVGFDVELVPLEVTAALKAWTDGELHGAVFAWSGRNDPLQTLFALYSADGPSNIGHTSPAGMEELMSQARTTYDAQERTKVFQEISALAADYYYHVVYYFDPRVTILSSDIEGYEASFVKKPDFSMLRLKK